MKTWLVVVALLLPMTACDDDKSDEAASDDDGSSSKKKKKKKKKKAKKYRSEALNMVGAMSRGAAAAFEREQAASEVIEEGDATSPSHQLCKSATAVPAKVPKGGKGYQPNTADGEDFESGDSGEGWRCLKFAATQPIHCQYSYIAGGPFKSTKRGNPSIEGVKAKDDDGNALVFEAAAECDFDGDGETSLYARIGGVNPKTQRLKVSTQVFIDEDGE
jgi:type IV pilus assembly protein PilA